MAELQKTTTEQIPYIGKDTNGDGIIDAIPSVPVTGTGAEMFTVAQPGVVRVENVSTLATAAKQDIGNTSLATIAGKDFATQTTLAAILAKLIAAPATEAKQDTGNATLASILAKLADPATQTTLAAVLAQLQSGVTPVTLNGSLPSGSNLIGKVILNGTGAVSLNDAMIILPTDAQAVKKTKQFETTTALGASAVYTGATIDTSTERRVTGFVSADQAGTLTIESSTNGTNWYTVFTQEVTANTTYGFDVPCYSEYSRVKYTNGSTAQTAFRLVAYTLPI